jgi:uncharacterized membrane protein YciS (DUF1049 family)
MKILIRLLSFIIILFLTFVLIQNVDFAVNVQILDKQFEQIRLPLILVIAVGAGFIIGAILMSLIALQYKAETHKANKRIKGLMSELDSLRNLSIDDVSIEDLDIDHIRPVQIPIIEKSPKKDETE